MAREISIANQHPRLRLDRRAIARAIRVLDAHEAEFAPRASRDCAGQRETFRLGELSVVFLADPALAELHAQFFEDPSTTDVITFEGDPALGTAGEICVSADTAAAYARKHRRDFSSELTLYLVHGWLHLAGYDDLAPAKKRVMRRAEARAMQLLQQHGSVPRFKLA